MLQEIATARSECDVDDVSSVSSKPALQPELGEDFMQATYEAMWKIMMDDFLDLAPKYQR